MASSSNLRHQNRAGLVEEHGIELMFKFNMPACAVLSLITRCVSQRPVTDAAGLVELPVSFFQLETPAANTACHEKLGGEALYHSLCFLLFVQHWATTSSRHCLSCLRRPAGLATPSGAPWLWVDYI